MSAASYFRQKARDCEHCAHRAIAPSVKRQYLRARDNWLRRAELDAWLDGLVTPFAARAHNAIRPPRVKPAPLFSPQMQPLLRNLASGGGRPISVHSSLSEARPV